jgi:ABC-type uncharacterized transport system ATPase subunit
MMGDDKVSNKVKKALKVKSNIQFLHRLSLLPPGTSKKERVKTLNKGNQAQRKLAISVLHYVMTGAIPMRKDDFSVL